MWNLDWVKFARSHSFESDGNTDLKCSEYLIEVPSWPPLVKLLAFGFWVHWETWDFLAALDITQPSRPLKELRVKADLEVAPKPHLQTGLSQLPVQSQPLSCSGKKRERQLQQHRNQDWFSKANRVQNVRVGCGEEPGAMMRQGFRKWGSRWYVMYQGPSLRKPVS